MKIFRCSMCKVIATLLLSSLYATYIWASVPEKVIYSLAASSGSNPVAGLVADGSGNLYGAASAGGRWKEGAIFELSPVASGRWRETILYSFTGKDDGGLPFANLIMDNAGNLYGTTVVGGITTGVCATVFYPGCGTVFTLTRGANGHWTERVLYRFQGGYDGAYPATALVFDTQGRLYGTTDAGGRHDSQGHSFGTVFELRPTGGGWQKTTLYRFNGLDGDEPLSALVFDSAGNLFGTTIAGGTINNGTVYEMTHSGAGWTQTVLYNFDGWEDGALPLGNIAIDQAGDLYGVTFAGGANNWQRGTIFKLSRSSTGWQEVVLHSFVFTDGEEPSGGVILDAAGSLYGTTYSGGAHDAGTVFTMDKSTQGWQLRTLYDFSNGNDGGFPDCPLLLDPSGKLYGTTYYGGYGRSGVVFEISH